MAVSLPGSQARRARPRPRPRPPVPGPARPPYHSARGCGCAAGLGLGGSGRRGGGAGSGECGARRELQPERRRRRRRPGGCGRGRAVTWARPGRPFRLRPARVLDLTPARAGGPAARSRLLPPAPPGRRPRRSAASEGRLRAASAGRCARGRCAGGGGRAEVSSVHRWFPWQGAGFHPLESRWKVPPGAMGWIVGSPSSG